MQTQFSQFEVVKALEKAGVVNALYKMLAPHGIAPRSQSVKDEIFLLKNGAIPWLPDAFATVLSEGDRRIMFDPKTCDLKLRNELPAEVVGEEVWAAALREIAESGRVREIDGKEQVVYSDGLHNSSQVVSDLLDILRRYHFEVTWGRYAPKKTLTPTSEEYKALVQALDEYFLTDYHKLSEFKYHVYGGMPVLPKAMYWVRSKYRLLGGEIVPCLIPALSAIEAARITMMLRYHPDIPQSAFQTFVSIRRGDVFPDLKLDDHPMLIIELRYKALNLLYPQSVPIKEKSEL